MKKEKNYLITIIEVLDYPRYLIINIEILISPNLI
jgi:hypothetical protein